MSKINKIRLSGTDYDIQDVSATSVVELSQQQYDNLPATAKTSNILYIITDAQAGDLTNYYTKTEVDNAITAATSTKQDQLVSGTNIKTINNESILGSGNIDIQGGGSITVDTSLDSNSTNPVQNQALYDELVINGGSTETTLTFEEISYNYYSTNYPSGCTEVKVTAPNWEYVTVYFLDANDSRHGYVEIDRMDGESININVFFNGASYSIDNNEVVISYPPVTDVSKVQLDNGNTTVKAVVTQTIHLKDQVVAIQDSLSGYVTTDTEQIISGRKIFTYSASSSKAIEFKQTDDSAKVGFRVRTSAETNNELASFEFRPNTFTVDGVQHPLLYFGHYRTTNIANAGIPQTYIGFRQYDQLNAAAYHYLIPLPERAKTPFSLTTSFKDYYAPMGFKNGSTMITADDTGVVDLSSEFGGLKLVKLSQSEYDSLSSYDSNTLYVIVN